MSELEHYLPMQHELGETPIWVPEENALYWVDIGQHMIYRIDTTTGEYQSFKPDMPVRGLCRRSADSWLVITDSGLAFWDRESNACRPIIDPYADNPDIQFNDGMIDRQGRLLVGSFNCAQLGAPDGSLYRLDEDCSLHRLDGDLVLSNGIAISPDGKTLYVAEMFAHKITAYDFDPEKVTGQRLRFSLTVA